MPGKMGPLLRRRAIRLSRISSLTRRLRTRCSGNCELLRSSPRFSGSLLKGWIPPGSRPPLSHSGPTADECWYSTPATILPARDGWQHQLDYRSRKNELTSPLRCVHLKLENCFLLRGWSRCSCVAARRRLIGRHRLRLVPPRGQGVVAVLGEDFQPGTLYPHFDLTVVAGGFLRSVITQGVLVTSFHGDALIG